MVSMEIDGIHWNDAIQAVSFFFLLSFPLQNFASERRDFGSSLSSPPAPPPSGNTWDLRLMCFFSTGLGCRSAPTIKGECERFPQHVKMSRGNKEEKDTASWQAIM